MKNIRILLTLFLLSIIGTGCQEITIYFEMPQGLNDSQGIASHSNDSIGLLAEQVEFTSEPFDPNLYFFPTDMLPADVIFANFNKTTINISYLDSNGDLLGIAHVRQYQSYPADLFVTQMIIQSPVPIEAKMLRAGHFGEDYVETEEEFSIGENSVFFETGSTIFGEEHILSYRFYKGNAMVIVDLFGWNEFVTKENLFDLANMIYQQLPEEIPEPSLIQSPPLELNEELQNGYFGTLELVQCEGESQAADTFINGNDGICFHANILRYIDDFRVGIYSNHYGRLIYEQECLYTPPLGDWTTGLFYPVWGFGWQHLPEGDYQALFWVEGQLVAALPFHFTP